MKTNVVTNVRDAKKAFDEVSLARVFVMATESLCPDTFEAFEEIFLKLKERRSLSGIAERGVRGEPIPNYAGYEQKRKEIREAWVFLRENNHTVPDDIIDLMRDAALEKMNP